MKKILYTASTLSHIRNFHLPYLRWFRAQGYTVHVAAGEGGELPDADRVFPLPLEKSILAPRNLAVAARLRTLIRAEGYDLISTHTSLAAFFTRLAAGGARRPLIVNTCHGYLFDDKTPLYKRALLLGAEKLMAGRTDLLFVMNCADHEIAQRHRLSTGAVVPIPGMGVDLSRYGAPTQAQRAAERAALGLAEQDFALVYAAEFSPRKNQETLLAAMALLPHRVHLLLAGDGALLDACRARAEALGLAGRVHFLGHCTQLLPLLHAADAAVSASRYEGLPFNLMEAMSTGLPLVVSDVKGNADLIVDGENGYRYPYGDAVACAERVGALMDAPRPAAMGAAARQAVAAYSLSAAAKPIQAAYEQLLQL